MIYHKINIGSTDIQLVELASYPLVNDNFTPTNACLCMEQIFHMSELNIEHVYYMFVDNQNRITSVFLNEIGNEMHCENSTSLLCIYLSLSKAAGFAMFHNHPNREWRASKDDIDGNKNLLKIAEIMKVEYLGSYIVGDTCYVKVGSSSINTF